MTTAPRLYPIYRIGTTNRRQAALRADGTWFERWKRPMLGWSGWHPAPINDRPIGAWYDPQAGKARLPE